MFVCWTNAQYEWQPKDAVDEIRHKLDKINADNCGFQPLSEIYLPEDTVSHLPDIKDVVINPVFPNRTALLHLSNMALNRGFFFSYISQARFIRPAINDTYDPGMMYYFLSTVADVSANSHINASAIYFAPNMSYSPSYRGFFNKTFPYFAPRTFRADDFNDPIHLEKMSTLNTFTVRDLGAFSNESLTQDYTSKHYGTNEWYSKWLPDNVVGRHDTKTTYQVEIRYANNTNETHTFHGPPGADDIPGPIKWTRPYFDCGRSNKWLVAAVVPIADIYPRHTGFRHVEYPTYTAVSVIEMDFERIDINQCPISAGNSGPNRFADTAKCKEETTLCEPLDGWGFRRGGYQCRCLPGYRLGNTVRRPFLGEIIERATLEQYYSGVFDCKRIGWLQSKIVFPSQMDPYLREQYLEKNSEYKNFTPGLGSVKDSHINIHEVINSIRGINQNNCHNYRKEDLQLLGDYGFGAHQQFANEAKMAVRLANFISAFLQISDPKEVYSGTRLADKHLSEDQMIGEALAIVMADFKIWSAGIFWDTNKFPNRTLFAPYAYKTVNYGRKVFVEDLARLNKSDEVYTNKEWFTFTKQRWSTNFDSLEKFYVKLKLRYTEEGGHLNKFEYYPTFYKAANLDHGYWSAPYYDCNGPAKDWFIRYAVPFFGWDSLKVKLEFKGAITVTMPLLNLDINQCPQKFYEPNAFKGTHKCDQRSSYCVPIQGRGYDTGGYKCECIQGYEFPFEEEDFTYFDGQMMEDEFMHMLHNNKTRYDTFKCRIAGAALPLSNAFYVMILVLCSLLMWAK